MIPLDRMANKLLFATIRIVARRSNGVESIGTGFFFNFKVDEERSVSTLITNNHVVKDASEGIIFLHEGIKDQNNQFQPTDRSFSVTIADFESNWIKHPDENIDLCAMPFAPLRQLAENSGKFMITASFDESMIYNQEQLNKLTALEEVVMVGYPNGLWDDKNNFPVLRKGITASHPATNFQDKAIGVADIAAIPGSSGSPILIFNEGAFSNGGSLIVGNRYILLGLLFAGPQMKADGSIRVVEVPTVATPIASTMIPIHLGYYIKASELLILKQHMFLSLNVV